MGTSGQLPMRLALCLLIFLIVVSERFEIDFVLGAFVAGAVVRAALPEHEHKAMAVSARRDRLRLPRPGLLPDVGGEPRCRRLPLQSRHARHGSRLCIAHADRARGTGAAAL